VVTVIISSRRGLFPVNTQADTGYPRIRVRMLHGELRRRSEAFATVSATNVVEYRQITSQHDTPRILLLVDGFASFRDEYEVGANRAEWFEVFRDILADGRSLGIHVVFTADRSSAVPTSVRSMVERNVLLRMTEESYRAFNVSDTFMTADARPGRAILDGLETQIAVLGGTPSVSEQAVATEQLVVVAGSSSGYAARV
jgi:DNA segregation ATPase FtsK/SpoIIIE, S-DNA-T family